MTKEFILPAKGRRKVICTHDEIDDSDLRTIEKLDFDVFVWAYHHGCYEGSGVAVIKIGDKYAYHELGHCSCNGPLDNIGSSIHAVHTLEEVETLLKKHYEWEPYGEAAIAQFKENI